MTNTNGHKSIRSLEEIPLGLLVVEMVGGHQPYPTVPSPTPPPYFAWPRQAESNRNHCQFTVTAGICPLSQQR